MGNILCCFGKQIPNENIHPAQGGTGQQFRSGSPDGTQNERRDGSDGLEGQAAGRTHQNEAPIRNSLTRTKLSEHKRGNKDSPEGLFRFGNASSSMNSDKATNARREWKQTDSSVWYQSEARKQPTSHPAERKNHIKPDLDRSGLRDKTSSADASLAQANVQSKIHLNRISSTNKKKSNHSKSSNRHAPLLQQRQIDDITVPSPNATFDLMEIDVISEENDVKNIKGRRSTYDNVTPDQDLPSISTSVPGLDYREKKIVTNFHPTTITNSSQVNQPELQRNMETTNPPSNIGWSKSSNGPFTHHQYMSSSVKEFATNSHSDVLSFLNSSPTNDYYISAYAGSLDGIAGMLSGSTATPNKVDEIGDVGHTLPPHYHQSTKPPINDFNPFDQNRERDFSGASVVEVPGCVAKEKVYPTPPIRSSSLAAKVSLPEDLIQLESKKGKYEETHFPADNHQKDNRLWDFKKKDISSSDKVDEMRHRKNFEVNPGTSYNRDFFNQISQSLEVWKKQSSQENKWNVEKSWSNATESSLPSLFGSNLAFEPKANSETHKPSPEGLGVVDRPLLKHATEEPSKNADDDVHKMTVDLTDQVDAAAHESTTHSSSLNTLSTEKFFKKVDDTAEENLNSKALSNADGDERPDQHEATSEKQLGGGLSFYDEVIRKTQRLFGEGAATHQQKAQDFASGIGSVDVERRSQGKQASADAKANTAGQFDFPDLAAPTLATETSNDISRNDTLEEDEAKPPRADQHYGEGQACNFDGEFSESFVVQYSALSQVGNEDADTWNDQKLISFNSSAMGNGETPSWSGPMSVESNSFPSIKSTVHFDATPQGNQTPSLSIGRIADYTYHDKYDFRVNDPTGLLHLQYPDKEQPDPFAFKSGPRSLVRDFQLSTNFDTSNTFGILSSNLQEPGVQPQLDSELREIGEDDGKGQFLIEFNRGSSSYDIKPMEESPIKATGEVFPPPIESAYAEGATPVAQTQHPKDSQAEALSETDTDKDKQTELQKQIIRGLEEIREKAKSFEKEIEDLTELEDSNKHYYIEESLRRLVDKLDDLYDDILDDNMLRGKRKEVYRYIFPMFDELDNKVQVNRERMEEEQKE